MRVVIVLFLVFGVLWWLSPTAERATLVAWGPEAEVIIHAKPALSDEALRALTVDLPAKGYFGAFAVGPGGRFGWVNGRHDPQTARFGALERCGEGCEVIVEVQPKGYVPHDRPVSAEMAAAVQGRPGAFYYALAPNGAWSVQGPEDFRPGVDWKVLGRCRAQLTQGAAPCQLFWAPLAP